MITEDIISKVPEADIETLYKIFRIIRTEDREKMEERYEQIRNGIKVKFSIHDYFERKYNEKIKEGIVIIRKDRIKVDDFRTELEEREDLMRITIINELDEKGTLEGR